MTIFTDAYERLLKVFFPARCELCGDVIEFNQTVCRECKALQKIKPPVCDSCGSSKADCKCKKKKNEFEAIAAVYYYRSVAVKAVHRFKDSGMTFLSKRFCKDMAACINERFDGVCFDAVTYVPMRRFDELLRGYNQSELLARGISEIIGVELKELLVKTHRTKPQKRSSARERKVNVFGAFDVKDKDFVRDKTILLIDDVKTTGSTLNECAKMLKIYGAKAVYCATLAVVNNPDKSKKEIKK